MLERWPLSWPLPACSTAQSSQRKVSAGSVWVQGQDELLEGMSTRPPPSIFPPSHLGLGVALAVPSHPFLAPQNPP